MKIKKGKFLTTLFTLSTFVMFGASAVVVNPSNGRIAYAYGEKTIETAIAKAKSLCPECSETITTTEKQGYGAITRSHNMFIMPETKITYAALCGQEMPVPYTNKNINGCDDCEFLLVWKDELNPTSGVIKEPLQVKRHWVHDYQDLYECSPPGTGILLTLAALANTFYFGGDVIKVKRIVFKYHPENDGGYIFSTEYEYYSGMVVGRWRTYKDISKTLLVKEEYLLKDLKYMFQREFNSKGEIISYTEYAKDMKNGMHILKNSDKVLLEKGQYIDDKKTGDWEIYDKKTLKLLEKGKYTEDQKDGPFVLFNENGSKLFEGTYSYGKRMGYCKEYSLDGILLTEGQFKNDQMNGLIKEYFDNGNIKSETTYIDGTPNGPCKTYFENTKGKLKDSGSMTDGARTGEWIEIDENGTKSTINY